MIDYRVAERMEGDLGVGDANLPLVVVYPFR